MADDIGFVEQMAPSTLLKSVKSDSDIDHVREAMRQDGAALAEFFSEFEQRLAAGERLSELDVDSMLIEVRSRQPHYVSQAFQPSRVSMKMGHYRITAQRQSSLAILMWLRVKVVYYSLTQVLSTKTVRQISLAWSVLAKLPLSTNVTLRPYSKPILRSLVLTSLMVLPPH
jgi:hypothetical protein